MFRNGLGCATSLLRAAEQRIAERELLTARLSVEVTNMRARQLYEHLGYLPVGHETDSWSEGDGHGGTRLYVAELIVMGRLLTG